FATESAFLAVLFTFNLPEPLSAPDHAQRALSAAGDLASGGVSVRGSPGDDGAPDWGQTVRSLGWTQQTQASGGGDLELEKLRFAEVDSTRRSLRHRRSYDLKSKPPFPRQILPLLRSSGQTQQNRTRP